MALWSSPHAVATNREPRTDAYKSSSIPRPGSAFPVGQLSPQWSSTHRAESALYVLCLSRPAINRGQYLRELTFGSALQHAKACRSETLTKDPRLRRHPGPGIPCRLLPETEARQSRNRGPNISQARSALNEVLGRQLWPVVRLREKLGQHLRARLLHSRPHAVQGPN